MSTILEWARRSLDGTATQAVLADGDMTNGVNGDIPYHKPYDHLQPKENEAAMANGCSDICVIATAYKEDITMNGATLAMQNESKCPNGIEVMQFVAEETV